MNNNSKIINFLMGHETDHKGRYLIDLQEKMSNEELENSHDVIQWLFPLQTTSKHNKYAPVLTQEDIKIMKSSEDIKNNIFESLMRMVSFYKQGDQWITPKNHNFLRWTRIAQCLNICDMKDEYNLVQDMFDELYNNYKYKNIIGEETYQYWKNAHNKDFVYHKNDENFPSSSDFIVFEA